MSKKNDLDHQFQKTLQDLGVASVDWKRRISAGDVLYLLDQWPFLEIKKYEGQSTTENSAQLTVISARSGWKIHDFGNFISSSPGDWRFGPPPDEDQGGSGVGTLVNQAVITAFEMIELAQQHGWEGIELIDGHPLMAWAAWMKALEVGAEFVGYSPTAKDFAKSRRIRSKELEFPERFKPSR